MDHPELERLFQRYRQGNASPAEMKKLMELLRRPEMEGSIKEMLSREIEILDQQQVPEGIDISDERIKELLQKMMSEPEAPVIQLYDNKKRRRIFWYAAAAVLIVGVLATVWISDKSKVKPARTEVAVTHDVSAPKETRAVITLANGSKVYLDSLGNGVIAQESNVNVVKNEGGISYVNAEGAGGMSPAEGGNGGTNVGNEVRRAGVDYNTLFNPRGSKVISLTLGDGTKVWLNSESSLRYPANFSASSAFRDVEITGEAYFEVKHNTKQPFRVQLPNGAIVEDIGTSFNINAYPDEDATKTTLIEGSIKISSRLSALVAKPKVGEQVIDKPNSPLTIQHSPDIEEVTAWKNGKFYFNGADIKSIMRQVARWYDVDVVYEGKVPEGHFNGKPSRDLSAAQMLKVVEYSGVKIKIEGKKITILP